MTRESDDRESNYNISYKCPSLLRDISVIKVTIPIKAVHGRHEVVVLRNGHSV